MLHSKLLHFLPAIEALSSKEKLTKKDLLTTDFLLGNTEHLEMYYSPHNEYINEKAIIIVIGITPGWNQMRVAIEQAIKSIQLQHDVNKILKETKQAASLVGTTRSNLIEMLDQCGIPKYIGAESSASLFKERRSLFHTTSIIKYPVFYDEKNYTGHQISIDHSSLLATYAYEIFPEELSQIRQHALVIPLGKVVKQVLKKLLEENRIPEHTYLFGFPHPSGANGHRKKQFEYHKDCFISSIKEWSFFI